MSKFRRITLGGLLSLVLAQILYGGLIFSALFTQYEKPVSMINSMVCIDMADHLGFLLRAGKNITPKTASIFLERYRSRTDADIMVIADARGAVIARWASQEDSALQDIPMERIQGGPAGRFLAASQQAMDRNNNARGTVVIAADRKRISQKFFKDIQGLLVQFGIISAGVFLVFLLLAFTCKKKEGAAAGFLGKTMQKHPSATLRTCFLFPLLLGQVLFLFLLKSPMTQLYEDKLAMSGQQMVLHLQGDLERLADMGMPLSMISGMEQRLIACQKDVPSLGMAVLDASGRVLCCASGKGSLNAAEWGSAGSRGVIIRKNIMPQGAASPEGSVVAAMDPSQTARDLNSVLLDILTMTVVAVIFLYELLFLCLPLPRGREFASSPVLMRAVVFASLFATEMATSYAPIRIGELGLDLFGLPPDVVSGLPVSCELFMAGLAMFLGGLWSRRSGWRPMLMAGIAFCCAGSAASSLSSSPLPFILSRGLAGLGYGFINLSAQIFIIAHSDAESRAKNLAFMFAGLYAGALCGSTLGGLIADRLGYSAVFPVSAAMLLAIAAAVYAVAPREAWQKESASGTSSLRGFARFLLDRRMAGLLLFLVIPNALITVCLSQYFLPLSLSKAGVSPADIGRVFMAYCIIVMFAGPAFGAFIDKTKRQSAVLFCSMLLAAASIALLLTGAGMWSALLSISVLAISTSIASNGQGAYALSLPAAARFGRAGTIGAYNVAMRAGQVLGPLSLGTLTSLWDARTGLAALACFALASALLFLALSGVRRKGRMNAGV